MTLTMQKLDELAAKYTQLPPAAPIALSSPIAPPVSRDRPVIEARDARQRIIGGLKMISYFCGGLMRQEIDQADFLVRRIDELEAQLGAMRQELETARTEKAAEIGGYKKALRNIAAVLDLYRDPFDSKPFSKWKNEEKGKWMLAAAESIEWAVQRADNQLDPVNAVVIAPDEI